MEVNLCNYHMPMDPAYHPEIDESPLLTPESGTKYIMLVESVLWATVLGRFDIMYATSIFLATMLCKVKIV